MELRRDCSFDIILRIQRGGDFKFETISFEANDGPKPIDLLKIQALSFYTYSCGAKKYLTFSNLFLEN